MYAQKYSILPLGRQLVETCTRRINRHVVDALAYVGERAFVGFALEPLVRRLTIDSNLKPRNQETCMVDEPRINRVVRRQSLAVCKLELVIQSSSLPGELAGSMLDNSITLVRLYGRTFWYDRDAVLRTEGLYDLRPKRQHRGLIVRLKDNFRTA